MKKICFVATTSSAMKTFIKPFVEYIVSQKSDVNISIICEPDDTIKECFPAEVRYFPVHIERGISVSALNSITSLYSIFKNEKFDLVQYTEPNASLYASVAACIAKIPVRLYCQWGMVYVGFTGIKRGIFKNIERAICLFSSWVEPDSFGNLEFCHKERIYPSQKGSVVWNGSASGVDLSKFNHEIIPEWSGKIRDKYNIPSDAIVYGFVGRITRDKGINELFSAFKELCKQQNNSYLMLVGLEDKIDTIDANLLKWAHEEPRVVFCGFTKNVERYLAAMDIYVLPSYREGFGSVVIEAESMKLPVIVTNIPGPTDAMVNNKTGIVIPKKDIGELRDAMKKLADNKDLCLVMGEEGYDFVKKHFEQKKLFSNMLKDRFELMTCKGKNRG